MSLLFSNNGSSHLFNHVWSKKCIVIPKMMEKYITIKSVGIYFSIYLGMTICFFMFDPSSFLHWSQLEAIALQDMNMPIMAMSHCSAGWEPQPRGKKPATEALELLYTCREYIYIYIHKQTYYISFVFVYIQDLFSINK